MTLTNGNLFKEKIEFVKERFSTQEGLADYFIGTALWYFILVRYLIQVNEFAFSFWSQYIPISLIAEYLGYLTISIIFTAVGLTLTFLIIQVFKLIKRQI